MTEVLEPLELPSFEQGPHVFLSGPMGAGKSTVARALAARLGREALDLDALVEARAGTSIRALFAQQGEAAFRAIEASVVEELAARDEPLVVALGGGTVVNAATRRRLLERGVIVHLTADLDVLVARAAVQTRPLLSGSTEPREVLASLLAARASAYAEAHLRIDTSARSPDELARVIEDGLAARPILVPLGSRSYCARFASRRALIPALARHARSLFVADENTRHLGAELADATSSALVVLPPGEQHKNVHALERIWDAAEAADVRRDGVFVAIGGGVVGDVTGLAAATWLRGVPFVVVPTTLLAMADSAIGGKTAIDRGARKNVVGAFHQPSSVQIDVETLATLPARERRAGLAEIVKCAWLAGEAALSALELDAAALAAHDHDATRRALEMAVRVKARVVAADESEQGARRALNLGHTLGHAFESASAFSLLHGEAVALGLVAALRLACSIGAADRAALERVSGLLGALDLPVDVAPWLAREDLVPHLSSDKKRVGADVAFVIPKGPGEVGIFRCSATDIVAAAREFGSKGPTQVP